MARLITARDGRATVAVAPDGTKVRGRPLRPKASLARDTEAITHCQNRSRSAALAAERPDPRPALHISFPSAASRQSESGTIVPWRSLRRSAGTGAAPQKTIAIPAAAQHNIRSQALRSLGGFSGGTPEIAGHCEPQVGCHGQVEQADAR